MASLENLSRFPVIDLHSVTKEGEEVLVICAAGRFELPAGGKSSPAPRFAEVQVPPLHQDVYWGEPGSSSLRYEGQTAYYREGTDVYLSGRAQAPHGRPVAQMLVRLQVGPCQKRVLVTGDRVWEGGLLGLQPSAPKPFEAMPLTYERSFGGVAQAKGNKPPKYEPRNPVGVGLYGSRGEALEHPLPNLEDPASPLRGWSDRPSPTGFGAIARTWQPRLGYTGTYDQAWIEERAPLWPLDFNPRFFQAAAPGLVATPWLKGGEPVILEGFSPDGEISTSLPAVRLVVESVFRQRVDRRAMVLDAVQLEPDQGFLTLTWRATVPLRRELAQHSFSVIREQESTFR
jgi:hypothetical protein